MVTLYELENQDSQVQSTEPDVHFHSQLETNRVIKVYHIDINPNVHPTDNFVWQYHHELCELNCSMVAKYYD